MQKTFHRLEDGDRGDGIFAEIDWRLIVPMALRKLPPRTGKVRLDLMNGNGEVWLNSEVWIQGKQKKPTR